MKIASETKKKYDAAVSARKAAFALKKEKIIHELPQLNELYRRMDRISLQCMRGEITPQQADEQSERTEKEAEELLAANGYTKSDIEYSPRCRACADTGYADGEICRCLKKFVVEESYAQSNIGSVLSRDNFAAFDEKLFSDKPQASGATPREIMRRARKKCEDFASRFADSNDNLLILGRTGTGKTFLTHCVAKALIDEGYSVLYTTAYSLIDRIGKDSYGGEDGTFTESVYAADLLVIDDLGTERQTDYSEMQLFNVINERLTAQRAMLISTNLTVEELRDKYGERIISRVFGNFTGIGMHDEDVRLKKRV